MADKPVRRSTKNRIKLTFAATALIVFSGAIAQAQLDRELMARIPERTYQFISFCADHFIDCQSMVVLVDKELLPEGKAHICTIGIKDKELATKSIIGWLARREETHAMPTKTGIRTAIRVLWPC